MNFAYFVAKRISYQSQRSFSRVIIRIALAAVALSISIMIISDAIVIGFQNEIKNKITGFAAHIEVSKLRTNFSFENEPVAFDSAFVKNISQLPEVTHVQEYATKPGIIKTDSAIEGVVLKGVSLDFDWKSFNETLIEGKQITFSDSAASKDIIISESMAKKLNLKVGDDLIMYFVQQPPRARKFVISGIYRTSIEEIDKVFVIADIKHIRALNGWHDTQIGGYEIFLKGFDKLEPLNEKIRFMSDVSMDTRTIKERYPQIFDWLKLLNKNIEIILTLMAFVAAINMITALIIMILERTQMIGILKAIGASNWKLQKIFIYNAITLIGYGLLLGNVLALIVIMAQKYLHIIKLPQESYYVSEVPMHFSGTDIFLINLGAFIFCTLAMLLPSILVTRIKPIKAIRFE